MTDEVYLNFPVGLLKDAFKDIHKTMENVLSYSGYVQAQKYNLYQTDEKLMIKAGDFFGVTYGNPSKSFVAGEILFNSCSGEPMTGINRDILFDFYKNPKSDKEIAVLLAFLALKSILMAKPYIKTSNDYLIARMGGYAKIEDMPAELPEPLKSFATRRRLDSIKQELRLDWGVNYYSYYTRGFYVSIGDKFTVEKLALVAEQRRKSTKEKQLRQAANEARRLALDKIGIKK